MSWGVGNYLFSRGWLSELVVLTVVTNVTSVVIPLTIIFSEGLGFRMI